MPTLAQSTSIDVDAEALSIILGRDAGAAPERAGERCGASEAGALGNAGQRPFGRFEQLLGPVDANELYKSGRRHAGFGEKSAGEGPLAHRDAAGEGGDAQLAFGYSATHVTSDCIRSHIALRPLDSGRVGMIYDTDVMTPVS